MCSCGVIYLICPSGYQAVLWCIYSDKCYFCPEDHQNVLVCFCSHNEDLYCLGHQLIKMYFFVFTVTKTICAEGHQDVLLCFYSDKQDLCQWNMANGDVDNTENLTIEKICLEFSPMRRRNAFYKINKNILRHHRLQKHSLQSPCSTPHISKYSNTTSFAGLCYLQH